MVYMYIYINNSSCFIFRISPYQELEWSNGLGLKGKRSTCYNLIGTANQ